MYYSGLKNIFTFIFENENRKQYFHFLISVSRLSSSLLTYFFSEMAHCKAFPTALIG